MKSELKLTKEDLTIHPEPSPEVNCGKGWFPLVEAFVRLVILYNESNPSTPIKITTIKESYGALFLDYDTNVPLWMEKLVSALEHTSTHTCESCGDSGTMCINETGEFKVLCILCAGDGYHPAN